MATAAEPNTPPQAPLATLLDTGRALFIGLLWGALMLGVFGYWMGSKYENARPIVTNIFKFGALVVAALAIWQAFTLWLKKETPEQKAATLDQQRRLFSYILIGAGLGLIVLSFALGMDQTATGGWQFKRENFAETFGVLLFGLISMAAGYWLQVPAGATGSPIQFLLDKVPVIKMGLVIGCVGSLFLFGYLVYNNWAPATPRGPDAPPIPTGPSITNFLPELASLLFLSMLCLACVLWLNTGQFDEFGIRVFVLIFGGCTGIILFFETLGRALIWRQDIFLGGTTAWQGENAWHFWMCAYLMFVSLVLMGVSFNLAKADIRTNVVLRRVMYGYDAIVQAMLLIGILAILNVVIYALAPFSFDWTQSRGAYALADSSKNLIAKLPKEANVIVTMSQSQRVYKDVRNLLDNCEAIGNKFHVKYVPPDSKQMEFEALATNFPAVEAGGGRGVLIVYGAMPTSKEHTVPHTFVPERKLFDVKQPRQRGETMQYTFKGEVEILKELKFLVGSKKKRKIYFLQGDGEPVLKGETAFQRADFSAGFGAVGVGPLVELLEGDNYEIAGLTFGPEIAANKDVVVAKEGSDRKKSVPADCDTLIVAGVSKELSPEALDAIERYMDQQNGKMVVFSDVITDDRYSKLINTGMETLLRRYGVDVTNDFILRIPEQIPDPRAFVATVPEKSENSLASRFAGRGIWVKRSARVVKPADAPGRYKAEPILHIDSAKSNFIVEKDVSVLKDSLGYLVTLNQNKQLQAKVSQSASPLAVAVSDDTGKPRLVVFGDTEFITRAEIERSPSRATNYALTVSSLEWMAEREDMGIRPKNTGMYTLDVGVDFWRMVLLPAWLMLVALVCLGVGIWVVRRR